MPPKQEPPKTLKLGQNIEVNEDYDAKTSSLNLKGQNVINGNAITAETLNVKNINVMQNGNVDFNKNVIHEVGDALIDTDAVNLGQLNKAISNVKANDAALEKKINDETQRASNVENSLLSSLNNEISLRRAKDVELKASIDNITNTQGDNTKKINDLYAYFFGTSDVNLSKN